MSDNEKATSGANTEASGSVEQTQDESGGQSSGVYKAEFVQKLKKEKDNWRSKFEELSAQRQKEKDSELEAQAQYKQLWETEKQKTSSTLDELSKIKEQIKSAKIKSDVKTELLKLGLLQDHWEAASKLVDWGAVQLDPETELVLNADGTAKMFYEKYNSLGFFAKQGQKVNHSAPNMNPNVNQSDVFKSELKKAKTQKELDAVLKQFNMA